MESSDPRWFINHHCTLHDETNGLKIYVPKTSEIFNDRIKKIRKVSIGEKNLDCPEKVVMLVGGTGSGKSTLINAMFNYIMGVTWDSDFRLKLIYDETSLSQVHSQTDYITAYVIYKNSHSNVPFTMIIIDTPGFGNTAGIERDKEIADQMRTFFNEKAQIGVDKIDALGLVTQSQSHRLTPTMRYIFDSILSLFGKDIGNNIIIMVTFADYKMPSVLAAIRNYQLPYKKNFQFNNSALYVSKMNEDEAEDEDFDKMLWMIAIKSFKTFMVDLETLQQNSVKKTQEVLDKIIHLETIIQNFETKIHTGHSIINKLAKYKYQADEENDASEFRAIYLQILALTEETSKTMQTLEGLACTTNLLSTLDYIDCIIKEEERPG